MYTQSDLENKEYQISKRNFLDDYAKYQAQEIDMTLSGKYLYRYPKFRIDYQKLSNYPAHHITKQLEETIKERQTRKEREVVIGTGANGIIQNLVKIIFQEGGNLVTPYLTFNQPEYAVTAMGGYTKRVYMQEDMQINPQKIIDSVDNETKMIYLCNPNNPTGMIMKPEELIEIARNVTAYVVVDESGIEFFSKDTLAFCEIPDNMIIIRSFSKAYGIANLRVGYMICSKELKKKYEQNITINEVSGISCEYARRLLLSKHYQKNVELIIKEREKIEKNLRKSGMEFFESKSNLLFTKEITEELLEKIVRSGISVMPVRDQREKLHLRIAVQDKKTNQKFLEKWKEIVK